MRHQKKGFKLGRTHSHRKATLAALATALIEHKRITTTTTRAKALRIFVEPIISRAKEDTTHNRRQAFRHLRDKHAVTTLFTDVAEKIGDRPGGYTRIVKLGQRAGDSAQMAVIELVDYNDVRPDSSSARRRRTRRSTRRRGKSAAADAAADAAATQAADAAAEASAAEAATADAAEATAADAAAEGLADAVAVEDTPETTAPAAEDAAAVEAAVDGGEQAPDTEAAADADAPEEKKD